MSITEKSYGYFVWFLTYYARPMTIILIGILFWNIQVALYKLKLVAEAILYLLFCNDKSWKRDPDPAMFFDSPDHKDIIMKKTIIFVRHGESTWNETFNKGNHRSAVIFLVFFIPNLIKALLYELYFFISGKMDSWFYDAPLSHLGLNQAEKLQKFLKNNSGMTSREKELIAIMRGENGAPSSRIMSSSLRRALSTVALSFQERLNRRPTDTILIHPALQEISRNPDTLCITPAQAPVTASWIDRECSKCNFQSIFSGRTDMSLHKGNKPITTNGLKRMKEFNKYVFSQRVDSFVVGGHSIWFRSFFKEFLPYSSDHVAKKRKIINAGCVGFTLMKISTPQGDRYMVDQSSITVIYGGF